MDIWSYNDNWATKNNFRPKNLENRLEEIAYGTFLNIDSVIYEYSTKKIYSKYFNGAYIKKELDFVTYDSEYIEKNPNRELNIFRIIYMKDYYKLKISDNIKIYIEKYMENYKKSYLEKIYQSQIRHYKKEILTKEELCKKLKKIVE